MQILCVFWFGMVLTWYSVNNRLPDNKELRRFWVEQIDWIIDGPDKRDKILRICIVNHKVIKQQNDSDRNYGFKMYLDTMEKRQFEAVTLKSLRHNDKLQGHQYKIGYYENNRNPNVFVACCFEMYLDGLTAFIKDWRDRGQKCYDMFSVVITVILTFINVPMYLCGRIFNAFAPLIIVLFLYIDGGINLFKDVATFQVVMWLFYVILIFIWFIVGCVTVMEEHLLWHILPGSRNLKGWEEGEKSYEIVSDEIKYEYYYMMVYPIIERALTNVFGIDIATVILDYFNCIQIPVEYSLLVNAFGDEIAVIIIQYLFE